MTPSETPRRRVRSEKGKKGRRKRGKGRIKKGKKQRRSGTEERVKERIMRRSEDWKGREGVGGR